MPERLDFAGYMNLLDGLVSTRATGTLFAKTDDNHLVVAVVRDGEIVSLAHGPKRGEEAIDQIRRMKAADVRLDPAALAYGAKPLPRTQEILSRLWSGTPAAPASEAGHLETTAIKAVLCELLIDYLGPVAPILCEEKLTAAGVSTSRGDMEVVIRELAGEIEDQDEANAFLGRVRQRLGID